MATDDKIRDENLRKIDKYEYLMCDKILPSNERQIIELAETVFSPLENVFEKQTKAIEYQGEKQIAAITYQTKPLAALTNKDDNHKDNYRKYLINYFIKGLTK